MLFIMTNFLVCHGNTKDIKSYYFGAILRYIVLAVHMQPWAYGVVPVFELDTFI